MLVSGRFRLETRFIRHVSAQLRGIRLRNNLFRAHDAVFRATLPKPEEHRLCKETNQPTNERDTWKNYLKARSRLTHVHFVILF